MFTKHTMSKVMVLKGGSPAIHQLGNISREDDEYKHYKEMKDKGFKRTKHKYINNDKWMATYIKYCPLGYDE